jgi:sec-independent protein translocase protein TatA
MLMPESYQFSNLNAQFQEGNLHLSRSIIGIFFFFTSKSSVIMHPTFLIFGLGTQEIILITIIVLLLFGGKKIPELMRGLGRGVKEFNNAKANMEDEIRRGMDDVEAKKP